MSAATETAYANGDDVLHISDTPLRPANLLISKQFGSFAFDVCPHGEDNCYLTAVPETVLTLSSRKHRSLPMGLRLHGLLQTNGRVVDMDKFIGSDGDLPTQDEEDRYLQFLLDEGLDLLSRFQKINDSSKRRLVIDLVEALATAKPEPEQA